MAVQDALIIVEGPQDAESLARLLKVAGYERVKNRGDLPVEWHNLVSEVYPKPSRGIDQPHEVPHFRKTADGNLIAMVIAGGDSRLASALMASVKALKRLPAAVGFVLDNDGEPNPTKRHGALLAEVAKYQSDIVLGALNFPAVPGQIETGSPRTGIFVLPNNQEQGTLENVLLEAGEIAYGAQIAQARQFVQDLDVSGLNDDDLHERTRPSGQKKQIVGTVAALLKPGRALATSLQDNRWLKGNALNTALVRGLRSWLHDLLDIPAP